MPHLLPTVRNTIIRHRLLDAGNCYLVALSGGADSVALLLVLQKLGYEVEAAHCNFHLRGEESEYDEDFCRVLCRQRGIPLHVTHFDTPTEAKKKGESIEMAARRLRYAWFEELCAERSCTAVCTGHHRDDNVETLLLNLCRGTGIHGLTGMAHRRDNVVHPLLDATRAAILAFLEEEGQGHVTDSSNADTHFKRNLVRHELLPLLRRLNPSIEQTLLNNMQKLQAAEEAYDSIAGKAVNDLAEYTPYGVRYDLSRLEYAAQLEGIGHAYGFNDDTIRAIREAGVEGGRALYESATHLGCLYRGKLEICARPKEFAPIVLHPDETFDLPARARLTLRLLKRDELANIPRRANCVAMDFDKVSGKLTYRRVAQGDRFRPYGLNGSKLVSDYLTDCRLSQVSRRHVCTLCDERGILWLVGLRPDGRIAITENTQRILLVEYSTPTP